MNQTQNTEEFPKYLHFISLQKHQHTLIKTIKSPQQIQSISSTSAYTIFKTIHSSFFASKNPYPLSQIIEMSDQEQDQIYHLKLNCKNRLQNISCGSHHCIIWNKSQLFGFTTSHDSLKSHYALGFSEQLSQSVNLFLKPRKIPFFIPQGQEILAVECGNDTILIQVGPIFYVMGDNKNKQLGNVFKRIISEPEILHMLPRNSSLKEKQKNRLRKVKFGDSFLLAVNESGNLYGAGQLRKFSFQVKEQIGNGLIPLLFENSQLAESAFKDFWCQTSILLLTTDNRLCLIHPFSGYCLGSQNFILIEMQTEIKQLRLSQSLLLLKNNQNQYLYSELNPHKLELRNLIEKEINIKTNHKFSLYGDVIIWANNEDQLEKKLEKDISESVISEQKTIMSALHFQQILNQSTKKYVDRIDKLEKEVLEQKQIIRLYELYVARLQAHLKQRDQMETSILKQVCSDQNNKLCMEEDEKMDEKGGQRFRDLKYLLRDMLRKKQDISEYCTTNSLFE